MTGIEVGRVCVKTAGRDAGKKAVVVKLVDKNFAVIDGKNIKRRKCNLMHLFPTEKKIDLNENAAHEEVLKHLK